jgi:hypothetical protein
VAIFRKKPKQAQNSTSQRPRVRSYYAASSQQLNSSNRQSAGENLKLETRKRKLRGLAKNWLYVVLGILLGLALLFMMTLNRQPSVIVIGPSYRQPAAYYHFSANAISNNLLNLFKPTLAKKEITSKIRQAVPEAYQVRVNTSFFGRKPQVRIYTDKAMAIFADNDAQQYILSEKGRVLLLVSDASKTEQLVSIKNNSGVPAQEGSQFITPDQAVAFQKLMFQAGVDKSKTIGFEIPPQPHEILMRDSSRGGYYVRFVLDTGTINQQFGAYKATEKQLGTDKPAEYIDARLADKIFVK